MKEKGMIAAYTSNDSRHDQVKEIVKSRYGRFAEAGGRKASC